MRVWTATALAALLAACTPPAQQTPAPVEQVAVQVPTGQYTLDVHHSTVTVRAMHFGLARYTLRFNKVSGALNFNAEDPAQSAVEFTVDMTSLDTSYAGDRDFDSELQNSEWFDTGANPTATFRSTAVEKTGPRTARVTGDLTLHGVTRPITMDVTYNGSWRQHPAGPPISGIGFSAHGTIQRSQFGITNMIPAEGSVAGVGDEVELLVEAEFNKPLENVPENPAPNEPVN